MELQISLGICAKVQKNANIRTDKKRYRSNIKKIMLSRPYTYTCYKIFLYKIIINFKWYIKIKNFFIIYNKNILSLNAQMEVFMDYELMMNGNVKIGQRAPDFEATTTMRKNIS